MTNIELIEHVDKYIIRNSYNLDDEVGMDATLELVMGFLSALTVRDAVTVAAAALTIKLEEETRGERNQNSK